jgi:hypothetical protein
MNQDACAQSKKADKALNATHSKVLKDYAKDPQFIAQLKQAEQGVGRLSRRPSRSALSQAGSPIRRCAPRCSPNSPEQLHE